MKFHQYQMILGMILDFFSINFIEFQSCVGSEAFNGPPVLGSMHAGEWKDSDSTREVGPEQGR